MQEKNPNEKCRVNLPAIDTASGPMFEGFITATGIEVSGTQYTGTRRDLETLCLTFWSGAYCPDIAPVESEIFYGLSDRKLKPPAEIKLATKALEVLFRQAVGFIPRTDTFNVVIDQLDGEGILISWQERDTLLPGLHDYHVRIWNDSLSGTLDYDIE